MRNLLALVVIGLIVYTIISLVLRSRSGPAGAPGRSWRAPKPPAGPVAPDDDPEFLWRLEQQQRRAEREAKGTDDGSDSDQPGPLGTTP
ncbi:hypothetical protein [Pengzhenrongella sicca]|uniref:Uncharacterized protein n=1 Tax=Pengzhenrongella sicca TaxID=2819238 RepID=A0A8A4ZCP8_9MICO|nr:hypothetical protein [Pengzhenrongella sicca]QTE29145.1 hypothetical protein J4E96_17915 [Pengzhenrongella sicca]